MTVVASVSYIQWVCLCQTPDCYQRHKASEDLAGCLERTMARLYKSHTTLEGILVDVLSVRSQKHSISAPRGASGIGARS